LEYETSRGVRKIEKYGRLVVWSSIDVMGKGLRTIS